MIDIIGVQGTRQNKVHINRVCGSEDAFKGSRTAIEGLMTYIHITPQLNDYQHLLLQHTCQTLGVLQYLNVHYEHIHK